MKRTLFNFIRIFVELFTPGENTLGRVAKIDGITFNICHKIMEIK
jgi:hypothetical protein